MKYMKVMLVDDEVVIIEGMKKLFDWNGHGCEVVCIANDGAEAVNQARIHEPDLVIMDINLPVLSGLEAIHLIKERRPETAFIVVSGYDEFEFCREALRLKIADYMLKPLDFTAFGSVIERLKLEQLEARRGRGEEKRRRAGGEEKSREIIETAGEKEEEKVIFRLISYMKEHLSKDITLPVLAEEFHLNPAYISQMFKHETGIKYYSYLTDLRINKAKSLLLTTNASITEIAQSVGYGDYRVFSKAFKQAAGMSPSSWQKQYLENQIPENYQKGNH